MRETFAQELLSGTLVVWTEALSLNPLGGGAGCLAPHGFYRATPSSNFHGRVGLKRNEKPMRIVLAALLACLMLTTTAA